MKYFALAILLFCLCSCASMGRNWTKTDTLLEATGEALTVVDWGQTRTISEKTHEIPHPSFNCVNQACRDTFDKPVYDHYELNPLISNRPSIGKVNTYFIFGLLLHPVISYILPKPWRTIWQSSTIGLEVACVAHNASIGIGVHF